jgi:hypothetical protein
MRLRPFRQLAVASLLLAALAVPAVAADPSPAPAAAPVGTPPTHTLAFGVQPIETQGLRWDVTTAGAETTTRFGIVALEGETALDGTPVTATVVGSFHYIDGTGAFDGSLTLDSGAGDVLGMRFDAQVALGPSGTIVDGLLTVLGGTGRWASVTGYGVVRGARTGTVGSPVQYAMDLWLAGMPAGS